MTDVSEQPNELQIIQSILKGDSYLFHELIRPYERSVYVMAMSFLHNEADAEEVVQEAFLKAYRNLANFRGEAKFGTWLISITLNEARGRIRQRKRVKLESLDEPSNDQEHISPALLRDWREIPLEVLERQEVRHILREAVGSLPPIYRQTFLMRDVQEMSIAETAEALQITVSSVKVRLHRARVMLQNILAPQLKRLNPKRRWFPWS